MENAEHVILNFFLKVECCWKHLSAVYSTCYWLLSLKYSNVINLASAVLRSK